jgi:hypothetical protein
MPAEEEATLCCRFISDYGMVEPCSGSASRRSRYTPPDRLALCGTQLIGCASHAPAPNQQRMQPRSLRCGWAGQVVMEAKVASERDCCQRRPGGARSVLASTGAQWTSRGGPFENMWRAMATDCKISSPLSPNSGVPLELRVAVRSKLPNWAATSLVSRQRGGFEDWHMRSRTTDSARRSLKDGASQPYVGGRCCCITAKFTRLGLETTHLTRVQLRSGPQRVIPPEHPI